MAQDLTLVLRLLADAQSALRGVQAVNSEVRETGATARTTEAAAQNLGVVIVNAGQDGAEAISQLNSKLAAAQTEIQALKAKLANLPEGLPRMRGEVDALTGSTTRLGPAIQNAAFQIGDFAVQVGGGTSALRAGAQQIPQFLGAFGVWGAVIGAAFAVLAPLVTKLFEEADAASAAEDAIRAYGEAVGVIQGDISAATGLQNEYTAAVRAGSAEVIAAVKAEAVARDAKLKLDLQDAQIAKQVAQEKIKAQQEEVARLQSIVDTTNLNAFGPEKQKEITAPLEAAKSELEHMNAEFDVTNSQADVLAAKLKINGDLLTQIAEGTLVVPGALAQATAAAGELQGALATAQGRAEAVVDAFAAMVRGANAVVDAQPGTDFLSSAIDRAKALAGWMWSAAGAALNLSQQTPPLRGPAGMGDGSTAFASSHDAKLAADEAAKAHTLATPVPWVAPGGGSSGGGSGRSALQSAVDQGNEIMATLDQSLAAVNEKVSAGLMSTAEGTQAISDAKDRAANALAELIPLLDKLGPQGKVQADTWRAALQDLSTQLKGVQEDTSGLAQVMTEGFKAPFAAFLAGTKSASEAWGDFLSYVNNAIAQKLSDKFTTEMLGPVLDAVFAGFGGMFQFADGGVPGISDLSGQVLTQPTLFGMPGGGLGQAGEAGPEAVMPLKTGPRGLSVTAVMGGREVLLGLTRGKDGKLGVEIPAWSSPALATPARFAQGGVPGGAPVPAGAAGGASGGSVVVNVTNKATGAEPRVSERMEGNNRIIDVVIEAVRNGLADDFATGRGPAAAALQSAFGLSRVGR